MPNKTINQFIFSTPRRFRLLISSAAISEIEAAEKLFENLEFGFGIILVFGLLVELVLALIHLPYDSWPESAGALFANILVFGGVAIEVVSGSRGTKCQAELARRSNKKLEDAHTLSMLASSTSSAARSDASNALQKLEAAIARATELERSLRPRELNERQKQLIHSLRGRFEEISIAFELDAETQWFCIKIRDEFFAAGISVAMYPRAPDMHSVGILIYEPNGFSGISSKTVGPLIEIFEISDISPAMLATIDKIPSDIVLAIENTRPELRVSLDAPMIIVGGRFILPPPNIERASKIRKAAIERKQTTQTDTRELNI